MDVFVAPCVVFLEEESLGRRKKEEPSGIARVNKTEKKDRNVREKILKNSHVVVIMR